jgi:CSLREA domain-containing protein
MIVSRGNRPTAERIVAPAFWLAALIVGLSLLAAKPAHAETFTVTSTQDFSDVDQGDGICDTIDVVLLTPCTLRGAIQEANAFAGPDIIDFDIPLIGVQTIKPNVALPTVTAPVTIDGYTQGPAIENTLTQGSNAVLRIELDGTNASGTFPDGLRIAASNCVVRGLVINRFDGEGIQLGGSNNKVEGNFIGTDSSGFGSNVGSLDPGNHLSGVIITQGTSGNTVGGTTPENRNVISANNRAGVRISSASSNKVQGNLIGIGKNGGLLGNGRSGVEIFEASENFVGGNVSEASNTIAGNGIGLSGGDGVTVSGAGSEGNRILRNSINVNEDLGIDLVGGTETSSGTTRNDSKDPDTGPNGLQNYPFLTSATNSGGQTTIEGTLGSKPDQSFVLRFFSNPPNTGEGNTFIGQKNVTTDASGTVSFTFSPAQALPNQGQGEITATATDQGGNTSEFSKAKSLTQG